MLPPLEAAEEAVRSWKGAGVTTVFMLHLKVRKKGAKYKDWRERTLG